MRLVSLYLRVRSKRHFATVHGARRMLAREKTAATPPERLRTRHAVSFGVREGFGCWTVTPRKSRSGRTVIYLHGGAYVNEISPQHWKLIEQIADAGACVIVPVYGLAPQHGYKEAYRLLIAVYRETLESTAPSDVVFAGDSAGGGLALGFAQTLVSADLPQPGRVVLISPWVDISLRNPDITSLSRKDPWLAVPGARECGRVWADGDDVELPQLSPIRGPLAGLAPIDVYIGTRDILLPDVLLLRDRAAAEDVPFELTVCPGAVHVYPLTPTREGRAGSVRIVRSVM